MDITYILEFLKNDKVSPLPIISAILLVYIVLVIWRNKWFSQTPFLRALFSPWVAKIAGLLALIWWGDIYKNCEDIKDEVRFTCVSDSVKSTFNKISASIDRENFYELSKSSTMNLHELKKDFKAIAFTIGSDNNLIFEERLNNELQKHDQYSVKADDLDYVICYFKNWTTQDYGYIGVSMASCSTENAFVVFVDFRKQEVVDTVKIIINRNPESITTSMGDNKKIELSAEELYQFVLGEKRNH